MSDQAFKIVLGVDPYSRGVGFAVLEGPTNLVDWGLKSTGRADSAKAMRIIEKLINRFQPDVLAIEAWDAADSRRCKRIGRLLDHIAVSGRESCEVCVVSGKQLRTLGPLAEVNTKHGRAVFLAERFPELRAFLPHFRKPWMSEEDRMAIFDALGFALACLSKAPPEPGAPGET